jgi:hypothetical protein
VCAGQLALSSKRNIIFRPDRRSNQFPIGCYLLALAGSNHLQLTLSRHFVVVVVVIK